MGNAMDPDYELFAAVAEAGSLSAAGRAIGLSPAMVSKRMARLEARLGVRLVHRTTRRLALTEAGERFHRDVVTILAAIAQAEARLGGAQGVLAGPLRISAPTSFGRLHVAPHLAGFIDAHPRLAIEIDLSDRFVDLLAERVDVAIRIGATVDPGLTGHRLATSARVLCASPAYLAVAGAPETAADLAGHRLLAASGQMPWRLVGPRGLVTIDRPSHVRTNSSEVVRELTLAGTGIALRSLWDVGAELGDGRLLRVLPTLRGSAEVGIYAVHPRSAYVPPAVEAFVDFLRGLYAEPGWERSTSRAVEG
jgi:DNA-binding transcriptional LysR family regulator